MREIKFRAWDIDNKKMMYNRDGYFHRESGTRFQITTDGICSAVYLNESVVRKPILMQFTGLKDKNGFEIYEGDIVELEVDFYRNSNDYEDGIEFHVLHTGEVRFMPSIGFYLKVKKTWDLANEEHLEPPKIKTITQYRSKVIGNIYENPELK